MKHKLEKLPKSRIKLTIEVPASETKKYFDQAYEKLAPTVTLKGFRAGKAPRAMTLEAIGVGRLEQQALDFALPVTYTEALKEAKINPIQTPAIAIKQFGPDKDFIYTAEADVMPEIQLGEYKKIKVKDTRKKEVATKEEIDKIIERLKFQNAQFKDIDRPLKKGDKAEISFEGFEKNVKLDALCGKNQPIIIGSGALIPGFEDKLIGAKKGEKIEFDLDVPNVKDKKLVKKAHFVVKIDNSQEVIMPEVDDKFAKNFGHDKLEKLTDAIGKSIVAEKEAKDKAELENEIFTKLVKVSKVEIPEVLIDDEINRRIASIQAQTGPGFNKFLEQMKKTVADLRNDLRAESEKTVTIGLLLGQVAREENLAPKTPLKDQKEQMEVTRKTIDKLIEYATK